MSACTSRGFFLTSNLACSFAASKKISLRDKTSKRERERREKREREATHNKRVNKQSSKKKKKKRERQGERERERVGCWLVVFTLVTLGFWSWLLFLLTFLFLLARVPRRSPSCLYLCCAVVVYFQEAHSVARRVLFRLFRFCRCCSSLSSLSFAPSGVFEEKKKEERKKEKLFFFRKNDFQKLSY